MYNKTTTVMSSETSSRFTSNTTSQTTLSTATTTLVVSSSGGWDNVNPVPQPTTVNNYTPTAPTPTQSIDEATDQPIVQPRLLGGIFGGVAGVAIILLAIFMLLKRHKRIRAIQALDDAGYGGPLQSGPQPNMVQRSLSFLGAGALVSKHNRPVVAFNKDSPEQGFKKISGRKLPPAIGGVRPEFGSVRSNAQSSYYTGDDSIGPSVTPRSSSQGPGRFSSTTTNSNTPTNPFTSPPSSPIGVAGSSRLRDSTDSRLGAPSNTPRPLPLRPPIYNRQLSLSGSDGVGRSLASHDGSRGSRFTEDIT